MFADPMFRFADPAALFIAPDHYVYRMLASQGVPLEKLGVPGPDGAPLEPVAPRDVWRTFAEHYHLFRGTPVRCQRSYSRHRLLLLMWAWPNHARFAQTSVWFREALALNFNITDKLAPHNADAMCVA